jgi:hypothetical protein
VIVIENVPVVAVLEAVKVTVLVPVPPEARVTDPGLKLTVVPLGGAEFDNVTVPLNPFREVNVTVEVADDPCCTLTLLGEALMLKSGVAAPNAPIWLITVFQFWNVESARYSDSSQKVDEEVGLGSVAAPK